MIPIQIVLTCIILLISNGETTAGIRMREGNDVTHSFVLVNTPVGDIEGTSKMISLPDGIQHTVDRFLGIPYAEAPVGKLRFMKPVKKNHLGFVFRAHEESKACPQSTFILQQWVPGPQDMSEDCLKLNVYVPHGDVNEKCFNYGTQAANGRSRCTPKAVMVWIHGGAFLIGQSRIYNGERLAAFGDVIVVTINYRLGPLGFLSTGDGVVRGNAGLWDQAEAISWVYDNIASFGGDPNRITVFGESAGSSSAIFQAMYSGNSGKIRRVIASSGTPLCPWTFSKDSISHFTLRLAQRLGCVGDDLPGFSVAMHQNMISCLQKKSYQEIIENSFVGDLNETLFRPEFVPILDGEFITSSPFEDLSWAPKLPTSDRGGKSHQRRTALSGIDALLGNNYNDGEAIAKISVRMFINQTAGLDFDDPTLNQSIVEKLYVPKILEDLSLDNSQYAKDIKSKIHAVYYDMKHSNTNNSRDLALKMVLDMTSDYEFIIPTIQAITAIEDNSLSRSFPSTLPSLSSSLSSLSSSSSLSSPSSSSPGRHFLFLFNRKYPHKPTFDWIRQASHGDDLPYIFGLPQSMNLAFDVSDDVIKREWPTSAVIMTYWTNFAKTGDPNTPRQVPTRWERFESRQMNYLYLTDNMSRTNARRNLFEDRVPLWRNIMAHYMKDGK